MEKAIEEIKNKFRA